MAQVKVRTQVRLPKELLDAIDALVGPEGRSVFLEEAARWKVLRERQQRAIGAAAGTVTAAEHPEWGTPEAISAWVRGLRSAPVPDANGA